MPVEARLFTGQSFEKLWVPLAGWNLSLVLGDGLRAVVWMMTPKVCFFCGFTPQGLKDFKVFASSL